MYKLWRIILNLFKWSWYILNFMRECIINIFVIICIMIIIGIYLQIRNSPLIEKGALLLNLTGTIVDKPIINNKFYFFSSKSLGTANNLLQENAIFDIINILRQATYDVNITGIVLSLKDFTGADQATLQYLGKALYEFRKSGKPIYAIGDYYSQMQYFIASYANKIYLTPYGEVNLHGMATNTLYYKTLLDKLKINSHIFRVGTYKSVVEPFLRDNMSDEAKQADSRWINQLWKNYLEIVAYNRKTTPNVLFPNIQTMLYNFRIFQGNTAKFALYNKWIDEIATNLEISNALIKEFGWNNKTQTYNHISIYDYKFKKPKQKKQNSEKIAVIFANGAIICGQESSGFVGSDTITSQIRDAWLNPSIKAVILRIHSPGGSVTASEAIRSELSVLRSAGKPIVVSMGGIAASGGYWIATPADYIIASSSTLTGSIGIFGVINTIEDSLDSIGVHNDGVSTSPLANLSITKKLPEDVAQMMQLNVENGYYSFIKLVAQSRKKTLEEVNKIGQGYVWIGTDAINNGLIDQLGDFDDAVHKAAELAKLKQYQLHYYINEINLLDTLWIQIRKFIFSDILHTIQTWFSMYTMHKIDKVKIDSECMFHWNDPKYCYALCMSVIKNNFS